MLSYYFAHTIFFFFNTFIHFILQFFLLCLRWRTIGLLFRFFLLLILITIVINILLLLLLNLFIIFINFFFWKNFLNDSILSNSFDNCAIRLIPNSISILHSILPIALPLASLLKFFNSLSFYWIIIEYSFITIAIFKIKFAVPLFFIFVKLSLEF